MAAPQYQPLPRVDHLPRGLTGPPCCPYQTCEAHIPFIVYDIKNDGSCHFRYMDVQNRRLSRVVAIATLRYGGKTITPRRNRSNPPPQNEPANQQSDLKKGGVSYHIIRLMKTATEDIIKVVDLLIDDQSQYCLGFRRGTVVGENVSVDIDWSGWFRVRGKFAWPSFLEADVLPIGGDHSIDVDIGGFDTLDDILSGLWRYPDPSHRHDKVTLKRAFLRAVVVFCETLRLLSVWLEVSNRIQHNLEASALTPLMWMRIRNWSSTSEFVLTEAGEHHGNICAATFWTRYNMLLGYGSFQEILDELRLLNWHDLLLKHYRGPYRIWLDRTLPGIEVANPLFAPSAQIDPLGQME